MSSARLPLAPTPDAGPSAPPVGCPLVGASLSRRDFVSTAALGVLASAVASACGGSGDGPTSSSGSGPSAELPGVTYANGTVTIALASNAALAAANGFLLTNPEANRGATRDASGQAADVIVINTGANQWRAFTSVCTHQRNPVGGYANGRISCFFHGSQYDASGRAVVGPATAALKEYALTFDAGARTLSIRVA